jgi:acetyl-CoA carboxylase carboxyl transferase subunit alpha
MSNEYIPLEQPIAELELKIDELRRVSSSRAVNLDKEIKDLEKKAEKLRDNLFKNLDPYQTSQLARHPRRPNTLELIAAICSDFVELHGDRNYQDDKAIVGGVALLDQYSVIVIGHQKGRGTKENIYRNFGMSRPEGYRKALRLMSLAERFNRPIITFVDTPGAYPGVGAEERGQSEAIAKNIMVMARLKVPIISVVIGEGGSGGALAIAVANRVHMMEHSIYSVISPEGCASILFKDSGQAAKAAGALKLTSQFAKKLGVVDNIIPEPKGGAHRSSDVTAANIKKQILSDLDELSKLSGDELRNQRMEKFLNMGDVVELSH